MGSTGGTRSALATTLLHFSELGTELELLGSEHNMNLTKDQVDAFWTQLCYVSESLASFIPPSVACGSLDGTRED
jgi:hypothetical protein